MSLPSPTPQTKALLDVLNKNKFTDVTFLIGPNQVEFKANRVFLACQSPVFEAMLYGSMQESQPDSEIQIHDIEPDAFQVVLNYCYMQNPSLTSHNIIALAQIADKYQIKGLSLMCKDYFPNILNIDNICTMLHQSVNAKLDSYVTKCENAITNKFGKHAPEMVQTIGFVSMNVAAMKIVLKLDALAITEDDLWDAVLKWKEYQISCDDDEDDLNTLSNPRKRKGDFMTDSVVPHKKQRLNDAQNCNNHNNNTCSKSNEGKVDDEDESGLQLLKEVCPFIRFGLMSGQYFVKQVKPLNCLTDKQMNAILCYYQCPEETCDVFNVKPRKLRKVKLDVTEGFGIYNETHFVVSDNGKTIQGNGGTCQAAASFVAQGHKAGIHSWSVKRVGTPYNINCFCNIGITSGERKTRVGRYFRENGGYTYYVNASTFTSHIRWCAGEVVTVTLDCDKWKVFFFKNNKQLKKEDIAPNQTYYFAMDSCADQKHHFTVV
eukprot:885345_1